MKSSLILVVYSLVLFSTVWSFARDLKGKWYWLFSLVGSSIMIILGGKQ